ncbi:OmpA family protein [Portibacter marinus]|uniref:OmpA family protein n=1 Tax=Portibacter marinus TaxID=2898660 RepID=UPI001F3E767D|nr:OmpA family protein [Portibacter marinus]
MTKKLCLLAFSLMFLGMMSVSAQDDTWTSAEIGDEMTVDAEQNKQWRMGQASFSAKPKNAWELGIALGHFHINGDVPANFPSGFGLGLHIRKAINYTLSWRAEGFYSVARGIDGRSTQAAVLNLDNEGTDLSARTFRNFQATSITGGLSGIVNIGNLLFHSPRNKWNAYLGVGVSITNTTVVMDYVQGTEENGAPYEWGSLIGQENSRQKRADIRERLDGYDHTAENDRNVAFFFDDGMIFPSFLGTVGVSRKINKRVNISLEQQMIAQDFDKWDGHEWRSAVDQTNDSDIAAFTSIRIGVNLGNFDNVTEPLYWLNPLDATYNDIAELKQRPVLDLTDTDGDGIIDMLDQELDSPAGCPVDTRGIVLDSDGDGIADCKDQEPFSAPGYDTDEMGVAIIPDPGYMTESDVNDVINSKMGAMEMTLNEIKDGCGNWFLPMIHFDLDKYYIKPEFYGQLHHVGELLQRCPGLCVTVVGHTDARSGDDYNRVLSYNRANAAIDYLVAKYGVDRERMILMYGGEEQPLVDSGARGSSESKNYMNRRVEFRVCQPGDEEMAKPDGPNAGQGPSGRTGSQYSGNKNSGY